MIRLTCPKCEKKLSIDDRFAGRLAACPRCKTRILVPNNDDTDDSSEELPVASEAKEDNGDEPDIQAAPPAKEKRKRAKDREAGKTDSATDSADVKADVEAGAGYRLIEDDEPGIQEAPPAKEKPKRAKDREAGKTHSPDVEAGAETDAAVKEKIDDDPQSEEAPPAKGKSKGKRMRVKKKGEDKPVSAHAEGEEEEKDDEAKEGDESSSDPEIHTTGNLKSPIEALMSLNWLWLLLLAIGSSSLVLTMVAVLYPRLAWGVFAVGIFVSVWGLIWWLTHIVNESILQGLLCLCVPGYIFWYFSSHYDDQHRPFFVTMTGILITFMGGLSLLSTK